MTQTYARRHLRLTGRRVRLEPLAPRHTDELYAIIQSDAMADRWPRDPRGLAPRAEFEESIWRAAPLQYAMVRHDSGDVVGAVQGMDHDDRSRTIHVSTIIDPDLWNHGWPLEGVVLFIDILFAVRGFRKAYFYMADSVLQQVGGAMETWLTKEVTFSRHTRTGDGYEDWHICSLFAREWDPSLVELVTGPPGGTEAGDRP